MRSVHDVGKVAEQFEEEVHRLIKKHETISTSQVPSFRILDKIPFRKGK